ESGQNGTQKVNIYKDQDFSNDAPPPIPPRPPDMIRNESPSPPPPPNLPPPGGPIYVRLRRDDDDDLEDLNFRYKPRPKDGTQSESSEEDPTPWYLNGSNEVPRTAWEEDEEEAPPPPPPRNDQLGIIPPDNDDDEAPPPLPPRNDQMKATPSHEAPPMRDEVTEDRVRPPRDETGEEEEEEEEEEFEEDTGHFLGVGRGDETGELPPLPPVRPPRDLTPPPLPVKMRKKEPEEEREREKVVMGSSNDEEALIRELTELERLVDDKATPKQLTSEELRIKEASELRRRLREERATRLQAKVQLMQENLRTQETREYTVPLLLVGVALIVVSYSVYYYLTKS
uniref:Uncharacterized protein n=2 Tax=Amphimedon queenslandica TaxID=400682 RepID=A0A1X7TGT7_AMPQE